VDSGARFASTVTIQCASYPEMAAADSKLHVHLAYNVDLQPALTAFGADATVSVHYPHIESGARSRTGNSAGPDSGVAI
jgi:hypothetical protein